MPENKKQLIKEFWEDWSDAFFFAVALSSFLCAFVLCLIATIKLHLTVLGIWGLIGVGILVYFSADGLINEVRDRIREIRNLRQM